MTQAKSDRAMLTLTAISKESRIRVEVSITMLYNQMKCSNFGWVAYSFVRILEMSLQVWGEAPLNLRGMILCYGGGV